MKVDKFPKYYEVNGLPVKQEKALSIPKIKRTKGWEPYLDILALRDEPIISEEAFHELVNGESKRAIKPQRVRKSPFRK
jgi:hypothetical protein